MSKDEKQVDAFKAAAKELGVNEDEAAFNANLRRIATAKPPEKPETKKR